MKRLEPLMTPVGMRELLERGISKGHWTLEDLDVPSPGWLQCELDAEAIEGRTPATYTNPLRDCDDA